jgi:asparagine synthase (glutamine-hydrolysing)
MCGICGAWGILDKSLLQEMIAIMRHRGPDDTGYHLDDRVMLGQCRLSIIDLETGKQPIYNEDRSIVLVYNGEIYNFKELRAKLQKRGHSFYTDTDTEVVVHAYEEYGLQCVQLFNGMFAFALYDSRTSRLVLARDRYGIKPLYYAVVGDDLIFGSEIKAILKCLESKPDLNKNALAYFLTLRYVPLGDTLFRGISKLLPGHYLTYDKSGLEQACYWKLQPTLARDDVSDEELMNTLKESVQRHMISDVPLGIYLSGGMDSATLVAIASQLSDQPLDTFCMGFGEDTDEFRDASIIAQHFGTRHHETIVDSKLMEEFPKMIWHMDFPKRNIYPFYLARLARGHVKVVLSGLGGDELFAGYDFRYASLSQSSPLSTDEKISSYLQTQGRDLPSDQEEVFGAHLMEVDHNAPQHFFRPFFNNEAPFMEQVLVSDFNGKMVYDFLPVDDATGMANSLETRVPFLDNQLVDLAFSVRFEAKYQDGRGKYPLRRAMSSMLPQSALVKKKQGFGPNPQRVYREELRGYAEGYLLDGSAVKLGFVNNEWLKKSVGHTPTSLADCNKLWDCLALEVFLRIYFDGDVLSSPNWDDL